MLDWLAQRIPATGIQKGQGVPSLIESFAELGVGRADTAIAMWSEEFAADQADAEWASSRDAVLSVLDVSRAFGSAARREW